MKQDRLEHFIKQNKEEFDTQKAPVDLWQKIESDLDNSRRKKVRLYSLLSVAASGVVILCAGLIIGIQLGSSQKAERQAVGEFVKAENYYQNQC